MTEPIDRTHAEAVAYVKRLRRRHLAVLVQVDRWKPRPCPPEFR